jgi:hypothetical protein
MQCKYSVTEIELLAIVETLDKFKGMLWGQNIKVFTDHANLMRDALGLTSDRVYQWRLLLEEYKPEILYIKCIHNTVADTVSWLEYDPSVNRSAESFRTTKVRNKQSHQRQNWMTVSKNWCKLDIDSDNLDTYTDKHNDWNLMFAHHEEEDEIYPITLKEIADAQRKDQELKVYFKKNAECHKRIYAFILLKTQTCYVRMENIHSSMSKAQGSQLVSPLPPTPWALASRRDDEICDVVERYAYYHPEIHQILQIFPSQ